MEWIRMYLNSLKEDVKLLSDTENVQQLLCCDKRELEVLQDIVEDLELLLESKSNEADE